MRDVACGFGYPSHRQNRQNRTYTIPSAVAGYQIESIAFEYTRGRKGGRNVQAISTESAPLRHAPVTFNGYEVNNPIVLLYSLRTGDWRNG
mgnify:CR=1 FL=1